MAEVLGRYFRNAATGVAVRALWERALQETRSERWVAPEAGELTRVRHLMRDEIEAIVRDYESGMGCVRLARKYGVSDNTVLVHLKAAGVEIRPRGKLSPEQVVELHQLHEEGWKMAAIGGHLGMTKAAVSMRLSRARTAAEVSEQS